MAKKKGTKKTFRLHVRLDAELMDWLKKNAAADHKDISQTIRDILWEKKGQK